MPRTATASQQLGSCRGRGSSTNPRTDGRTLVARRWAAAAISAGTFLLVGLSGSPAVAAEDFGLTQFDAAAANTQAGAHSDVTTTIGFKSDRYVELFPGFGDTLPNDGGVRTVALDLPPGLLANAAEAPNCRREEFANGKCPIAAQVGNAVVTTSWLTVPPDGLLPFNPIYNLVPAAGQPASIGLMVGASRLPAYIDIGVHSADDYHVTATSTNIETIVPIKKLELTLWGVPADPIHDPQRYGIDGTGGNPSPAPRTPFMVNPTDCDTTPVTTLRATSYGGNEVTAQAASPKPTGCDQLKFAPTIKMTPDTTAPDAPTGLGVDLAFPQNDDPDGLATPALRTAVVDLPEGMTINPGAADGLTACSDAESAIGTEDAASCPESSKMGTVSVDVPALRKPLDGALYIGSQQSDDPTSGKMFRFFLVANGQGVHLKLEGAVRADPETGQLRATFAGNPQVPVSSIHLRFKGGPRAVLANPATCGPKTATAHLASWGGPAASVESTFAVDCRSGLGWFGPYFSAGTVNAQAGAAAPFALRINKPDGQSDLNGLALSLPEGLLANLKGNIGTRVGTARVAAGPGSQPFWLDGPVVLEGPYGDAPFSLRVTVPAIAGPFNLGNVVVRQKIYVDPHDAHVTVVSDPLPTIVKGVPVRLQSLNVDVDKPGFMINPTSCAVKSIGGTLAASTGQTASVASRFQVGGCKHLPLAPKLSLDLIGKKEIKRGKHPQLSTTLTQQPGESGLKKVAVRLPLSLALDPDNAQALCKPEQAAAKACPAGSIIGKATAVSPVLNRPLTGDVFFVEGTRQTEQGRTAKTMPKLWVALRGEVALDVWADSSLEDSKYLVTTFGFVPDAPISSFKLDIDGGEHGILAVTGDSDANLCQKPLVAKAQFDGQNGKEVTSHPLMGSPCRFRVQDKTLYSTRTKVRVSGIGAGKLTLSGKGVKKTRRTIKRADVASITAKLTSTGKRAYKGRKALRLKVSFNPSAKGEKTHSLRTTVKRSKAKKKSSTRSHRSR